MPTLYDTTIEINSVQYGISGIDVGNSRVKIHHDDVCLSFPYDKDWKRNVQHHFRDHVTKRYLIGLSSVNPKHTTAIVKVLQRIIGHQVINAHQLLMRNDALLKLGSVENAGIDRMLGAIGAMVHEPSPLITVDCGTAITVNGVNAERMFLGGLIFAGISTQLYGLAKMTAGIPELKFSEPESTVGVNTPSSLMAGIMASVVGGISNGINAIQKEFFAGNNLPVVVTGGEGKYVSEQLNVAGIKATYHPTIVTTGILQLLANALPTDIQDGVIEKIRH